MHSDFGGKRFCKSIIKVGENGRERVKREERDEKRRKKILKCVFDIQ